ncbi:MAG: hypothetical protein KC619_20360 [Myxococcales bacterium]|nr:hypothetical protein [Myxococcales bacterium]
MSCDLVELPPDGTTCEEAFGAEAVAETRASDGGCVLRQRPPAQHGQPGWYAEVDTPLASQTCESALSPRLFVVDAPGVGRTTRVECRGSAYFESTPAIGGRCQLVRGTPTCAEVAPFGSVRCDPRSFTCQRGCRFDADCGGGLRCDLHLGVCSDFSCE